MNIPVLLSLVWHELFVHLKQDRRLACTMVPVKIVVWFFVFPILAYSYCVRGPRQDEPSIDITEAKLDFFAMNDLNRTAFRWINRKYGQCIRTDTTYSAGILNVTIFCSGSGRRQVLDSVVWNTSSFNVAIDLQKFNKVVVGYTLFICSPATQKSGAMAVNMSKKALNYYSSDIQMEFEEDCACNNQMSLIIKLLDHLPAPNATQVSVTTDNNDFTVVHIIIGISLLIIGLLVAFCAINKCILK